MTARDFALLTLDEKKLPNFKRVLRRVAISRPADSRDVALAEQIVVGVVKNILLLHYLIEHYSSRKLKSIDPLVQKILAIGLYQLRFLTRVPAHAAVDEAVEQTRRFSRGKAAGFVNAVLRNAVREPDPPLPGIDEPLEYARVVLSHPPELFRRLVDLVGVDAALKICRHNNAEPPLIVRLARGVSIDDLRAPEMILTRHQHPGMIVVEHAKRALLTEWSKRGLAQAQDPTSVTVGENANIRPGQTILDRCAGLGTKTLQMREILGPTGRIDAVDPSPDRTETLAQLVRQRNIDNVFIHRVGMLAEIEPPLPHRFDRILIDVPCSNSGVLARRPEARYAQTPAALKSLQELQSRILDDTAPSVAPDGLLIYSTCSIWPEENERQVSAFLVRYPQFQLVEQATAFPHSDADPGHYHDGGYFAIMRHH